MLKNISKVVLFMCVATLNSADNLEYHSFDETEDDGLKSVNISPKPEEDLNKIFTRLGITLPMVESNVKIFRLSQVIWASTLKLCLIDRNELKKLEHFKMREGYDYSGYQTELEYVILKREHRVGERNPIFFLGMISNYLPLLQFSQPVIAIDTFGNPVSSITYDYLAIGYFPECLDNLSDIQIKFIKGLDSLWPGGCCSNVISIQQIANKRKANKQEMLKILNSFNDEARELIVKTFSIRDSCCCCCTLM